MLRERREKGNNVKCNKNKQKNPRQEWRQKIKTNNKSQQTETIMR